MHRPIVLGVLLFFIVFAGMVLFLKYRPQPAPKQVTEAPAAPVAKQEPATERKINVKLFFNDATSTLLDMQEREVPFRENLRAQLKEVFEQLLSGPQGDLIRTIPEGTRLLDIFISQDGVVYVDFSGELSQNHPGGTDAEINTIYSIVNTVTYNFPQLKRVQILINDLEVDSLKGHLDLGHPLPQDMSMVSMKSQPAQTAQTQSETTS